MYSILKVFKMQKLSHKTHRKSKKISVFKFHAPMHINNYFLCINFPALHEKLKIN